MGYFSGGGTSGGGDMSGPGSSVAGNISVFADDTGKVLSDSGFSPSSLVEGRLFNAVVTTNQELSDALDLLETSSMYDGAVITIENQVTLADTDRTISKPVVFRGTMSSSGVGNINESSISFYNGKSITANTRIEFRNLKIASQYNIDSIFQVMPDVSAGFIFENCVIEGFSGSGLIFNNRAGKVHIVCIGCTFPDSGTDHFFVYASNYNADDPGSDQTRLDLINCHADAPLVFASYNATVKVHVNSSVILDNGGAGAWTLRDDGVASLEIVYGADSEVSRATHPGPTSPPTKDPTFTFISKLNKITADSFEAGIDNTPTTKDRYIALGWENILGTGYYPMVFGLQNSITGSSSDFINIFGCYNEAVSASGSTIIGLYNNVNTYNCLIFGNGHETNFDINDPANRACCYGVRAKAWFENHHVESAGGFETDVAGQLQSGKIYLKKRFPAGYWLNKDLSLSHLGVAKLPAVPAKTMWNFTINLGAYSGDYAKTYSVEYKGTIKRDNADNVTLVALSTNTLTDDDGAGGTTGWASTVTADVPDKALKITFQNKDATEPDIFTHAVVETNEISFNGSALYGD